MKEDMSLMLLKNIHHRFELRCITENYLEQLKNVNRFYSLYLFFNRELIDGLICVEDVESDSDGSESYYSETENMRHLFTEEHF